MQQFPAKPTKVGAQSWRLAHSNIVISCQLWGVWDQTPQNVGCPQSAVSSQSWNELNSQTTPQHSSFPLGGGFGHFFNVHPDPWGNDPIWLAHIFDNGFVQLPTSSHLIVPRSWIFSVSVFENISKDRGRRVQNLQRLRWVATHQRLKSLGYFPTAWCDEWVLRQLFLCLSSSIVTWDNLR